MQISFDLSDDVVKQLKTIPNLDSFINRVITNALQNQSTAIVKLSKWAMFAREIQNNSSLNLDGYSEKLKKDTLEIRENFIFSSGQE